MAWPVRIVMFIVVYNYQRACLFESWRTIYCSMEKQSDCVWWPLAHWPVVSCATLELWSLSTPHLQIIPASMHWRIIKCPRGQWLSVPKNSCTFVRNVSERLLRSTWTGRLRSGQIFQLLRKLKRQLAGTEEWSAADVVVECSLKWAQEGRSPQMWWVGVGKKESPAYHSMEVGC